MTQISDAFSRLSSRNEHGLIGYALMGYPDEVRTFDVVKAMVTGGVDIVELGIPFSDPIADGPTIQQASFIALQKGMTPNKALTIAKRIHEETAVPLTFMTYCNILFKAGFDTFLKNAKDSGIEGLIIPDLSVEESQELHKYASKYKLDTIFLVSPNTSDARLKDIVKATSGFLYLVSVFGTTGERREFEDYTLKAIRRVKKFSKGHVPLGVGFGISKSDQAKFMLDAGADAVIVGSAFIKILDQHNGGEALNRIELLARELKQATR